MAMDIALQDSKATYFQASVKAFQNWDWGILRTVTRTMTKTSRKFPTTLLFRIMTGPSCIRKTVTKLIAATLLRTFASRQLLGSRYVEPDTKYYQVVAK